MFLVSNRNVVYPLELNIFDMVFKIGVFLSPPSPCVKIVNPLLGITFSINTDIFLPSLFRIVSSPIYLYRLLFLNSFTSGLSMRDNGC